MKKLIVFDLDGTLNETKSPIDNEMSMLLYRLLEKYKVAIISGGKFETYQKLFLSQLMKFTDYSNLFLFPTTGSEFYKWEKDTWKKVYSHELLFIDRMRIKKVINDIAKQTKYLDDGDKIYGEQLEDRKTQITWSALGQDIVKELGAQGVEAKKKWREKHDELIKLMAGTIDVSLNHKFSVHAAGYTSIDVTQKGVDKAYGLKQMEKYLVIGIHDMLFVGDAIHPGGNDYPVVSTGVDYECVKTPEETKQLIKELIK